jgi:hypothetical protein
VLPAELTRQRPSDVSAAIISAIICLPISIPLRRARALLGNLFEDSGTSSPTMSWERFTLLIREHPSPARKRRDEVP